jgi:hypothetical protein
MARVAFHTSEARPSPRSRSLVMLYYVYGPDDTNDQPRGSRGIQNTQDQMHEL